jgi:sugar/nucleoside kinase (ribokinase family)
MSASDAVSAFDVLIVGLINADLIVKPVDHLPPRGVSIQADTIEAAVGGGAANTGRALKKLGWRAALAGLVGKDELGDLVYKIIQQTEVNVAYLYRKEGIPTSATLVLVGSDAERSFIQRTGSNQVLQLDDLSDVPWTQARWLHVGGCLKMKSLDLAELLKTAKSHGLFTSVDTDWDIFNAWEQKLFPALSSTDLLFTNESEGKKLTGETDPVKIAATLRKAGAQTVIVKRGEKGCYVDSQAGGFDQAAYRVSAIDTTGAGDSFVAGFIHGVLSGWSLEESARFATGIAACSVMAIGTVAGIPHLEWSRRATKDIQRIDSYVNSLQTPEEN